MSHNPEAKITCPNCGYHAACNYCAQCGQETHLHSESFWGLVTHFVAHYFHYDAKFWQTIRILYSRPGALTSAYWNKQRRRYIDPISLYIFISAVFFLIYFLVKDYRIEHQVPAPPGKMAISPALVNSPSGTYWVKIQDVINNPEKLRIVKKKVAHTPHKLFFFMIPFMAMLLGILFTGREKRKFSDHAVFALHIHSFCFPIFLLTLIPVVGTYANLVELGGLVYLVLAMHNTYAISWGRSVLYGVLIAIAYVILFSMMQIILAIYFIFSLA